MSNDDPFAAAELRDEIRRREEHFRNWNPLTSPLYMPSARREAPQQSHADYIRELDARQAAEKAARDAADLKAAERMKEIALHLPPPKPFTS